MEAVGQYVVDRATQTFSDALLATGFAVFLDRVFQLPIRISEGEGGFVISLTDRPLDELDVEDAGFVSLLPYLQTKKNAAGRPASAGVVEYEQWKQEQADYWAQRREIDTAFRAEVSALPAVNAAGQPLNRGGELQARWRRYWESEQGQALQALQPPPEWAIYQAVNQMSGISAYNGAVQTWEASRPLFKETIKAALRAFAHSPNDPSGAEAAWRSAAGKLPGVKFDLTWSQIFNPASGKGQNRAKMDGAAMTNSGGFWLWEYLKYVGAREILAPRTIQSRDRTKDRKSYVLAPASLDIVALRSVAHAFQTSLRSSTAVKMDVLGVLSLTRAILDQLPEYFDPEHPAYGDGPQQAVRGLYTAYYKYLGTSAAVMNLSFLSVPTWMHIHGHAEVVRYLNVLQELQIVSSRIEEERGEGYELLRIFRDFLSGNDLWPFLEFCSGYGAYLISDWERPRGGRPAAYQLSIDSVQEVILGMDEGLSAIVDNEGFRAIAYAIRQSTVTPQYQKSRKLTPKYEIRYGLGAELMRKCQYDGEFAAALGEFAQLYNAENAQKAETAPRPPYRRNVRTEDLSEVIRLIDEHHAKLVGPLLVAYGYATDRREAGPGDGTMEPGQGEGAEGGSSEGPETDGDNDDGD